MKRIIFLVAALMMGASSAHATYSKKVGDASFSEKVLVVSKDNQVETKELGQVSFDAVVLKRSECMEWNGDIKKFEAKACLVKQTFGESSFTDEIVFD